MTASEQQQRFEQWAGHYDATLKSEEFPFIGYTEVLAAVVTLTEAQPGMQLLDLGVGTGNLAAHFLRQECTVWGLDFSPAMLTQARTRWPQLRLWQADLLATWPPELHVPFDRVVSAYTLHHFDLPTKLALVQRVATHHLAPGGRIVIADVAFPTVADRAAAAQAWANWWDPEEYYWAADETQAASAYRDLDMVYTQVSHCGGVFVFTA